MAVLHRILSTQILANMSLRLKLTLVIMVVAVLTTTIQNIFFLERDMHVIREALRNRVITISSIIGTNVSPALRFRNRSDALELLDSLHAEPAIDSAYLFNSDGGVLAEYIRKGETLSIPLISLAKDVVKFNPDNFIVIHRIIENSQLLGTIYIKCNLTELSERRRARVQIGFIIISLGSLLAFILALGLQKVFTNPIYKLVEITKQIARDKDYSIRVPTTGHDEFASLRQGFNYMLVEIERSERDLAANIRALQRTNKELDQFVYAASHDLKAPLRAVDNLSRLIRKAVQGLLPKEKQEYLDLMENRVRRMEGLIDDLLHYSRVGRVAAARMEVNVGELLTQIVDLLSPPEGFVVSIGEHMPTFVTAKTPLEQVFRNLIWNAIKHHHKKNGHILVQVEELEHYYQFSVADDGPGINAQYHETIFQMFQTLKPRDEVEGSGMGLALVKKIVEAQGGKIMVESTEGSGAKFIFTWNKK